MAKGFLAGVIERTSGVFLVQETLHLSDSSQLVIAGVAGGMGGAAQRAAQTFARRYMQGTETPE